VNDDGRAIVSVRRLDLERTIDLELATHRPVADLAGSITEALGWEGTLEIFADPPGRELRAAESLAEAGVWDGAMLILRAPGDASLAATTMATPGPAYNWKRIDGG
jgi:hypothetical protein